MTLYLWRGEVAQTHKRTNNKITKQQNKQSRIWDSFENPDFCYSNESPLF